MEWLSQCVSLVKESLPPGTLILPTKTQNNVLKAPKRGKHATMARLQGGDFVQQRDEEADDGSGKRRKVEQQQLERTTHNHSPKKYKHTSHTHSPSISSSTAGSAGARPPQNAWFHPSHPLREDPRLTARRYNAGYDLEEDLQARSSTNTGTTNTSTNASYAKQSTSTHAQVSLIAAANVENGAAARRLKITGKGLVEKPMSPSFPSTPIPTTMATTLAVGGGATANGNGDKDQHQVNYDRVFFAEQVLQPVYHSPYPSIKPQRNPFPSNNETPDTGSATARAADQVFAASSSRGVAMGLKRTAGGGSGESRNRRARNVSSADDDEDEKEEEEVLDMDHEVEAEEDEPEQEEEEQDDEYTPHGSTDATRSSRPSHYMNTGSTPSSPHHRHHQQQQQRQHSRMNNTAARHQHTTSDRLPLPLSNGAAPGNSSRTQAHQNQTQSPQRSLWVCDKCFKYMPIESAYVTHIKTCTVNFPPGRKVYERANWGIWEIDGRVDKLYCQNMSLFGKLFIDHKSICFDVESFYYYVLTDSSPKRDHVIAYFTKEKFSIDDFNLATILVFPHVQQSGFGRLLMEFSYHLTKNSPTPGTPERPLSLLGARSYESLWMAMLVRHLIKRLFDQGDKKAPRARGGGKIKKVDTYMRVWERRKAVVQRAIETDDYLNYDDLKATPEELERQEEQLPLSVTVSVEQLAKECNLKTDDLLCLLDALGVLEQRKLTRPSSPEPDQQIIESRARRATQALAKQLGLQEWSTMQVCIDFELIVKIVGTWRIPAKPLLDAQCCWIGYTGGPLSKPVTAATRKNYVGYWP